MKIVIFAGGTGKRFWPVSRINSPKQFSNLISGSPLLRLRIDTLLKGFNPADIFISTGKKYEQEVKEIAPELPDSNFILEPEMRDTGPAVTLAVAYINALFPNEIISIQWSDHLIKDPTTFLTAIKEAEKVTKGSTGITFVTVPARFPSPHRGYIHFKEVLSKISNTIKFMEFDSFKEKPTVEVAKEYIESGKYGWNPGYWFVQPQFYLQKLKQLNKNIYSVCTNLVAHSFKGKYLQEFSKLEKISADYMFAEYVKPEEATVLWSDFGWSDVGEWIALKEALETSPEENVVYGNVVDLDSKDSIIYNLERTKLLSTIGLEGMVVVNTKDAVAIFPKEDNSRLKEYLEKLEQEGKGTYL